MKRRNFIQKCGLSVAYLSCVPSFLTACQKSNIRYSKPIIKKTNELTIKRAEFETQSSLYMHHPTEPYPIYIIKTGSDQYTANLLKCTHQHCTVELVDTTFICPCHGARFNQEGLLLRGPAEKNLTRYNVQLKGDLLIIFLT